MWGRPAPPWYRRQPISPDGRRLLESSSHASLEAKQSILLLILSRFNPTVHTKWRRGSLTWRFLAPYSTSAYIRTPKALSLRHSTPQCFIFSTQIRVSSVPLVHLVLLVLVLVHLVLVLLVLVHLVVIRRGREKWTERRRSQICRIFLDIVFLQYLVHHSAIFRCLNYYSKFFIYLISVL